MTSVKTYINLGIMTASQELLEEIENFLERTGLAQTTFGKLACNDAHLVRRLRAGNTVNLETYVKIKKYMESYEENPSLSAA